MSSIRPLVCSYFLFSGNCKSSYNPRHTNESHILVFVRRRDIAGGQNNGHG